MGATLDKPVTEKHTERGGGTLGDGSEYRFGASGMQGWRREMEDRHTCATEVPGLEGHAFFAVYDGHGGDEAADLSEQRVLAAILQQAQAEEYRQGGCTDPKLLGDAMVAGFKQCDAEIRPLLTRSGTTAVCCCVTPTHFVCANAGDSRGVYCKVTAAPEAGGNDAPQPDSSAEMSVAELKVALKELGVECSQCVEKSELQTLLESTRSGLSCDVVALSEDHKPDDPIERARVLAAGGTVAQGAYDCSALSCSTRWLLLRGALTSLLLLASSPLPLPASTAAVVGGFGGPMRIDGSLAVARALGDFSYKDAELPPEEQKVSPVPDIRIFARDPAADQLMLLACDGVFDVMTNREACETLCTLLLEGERDMGNVVEELLMICLEKDSRYVPTAQPQCNTQLQDRTFARDPHQLILFRPETGDGVGLSQGQHDGSRSRVPSCHIRGGRRSRGACSRAASARGERGGRCRR